MVTTLSYHNYKIAITHNQLTLSRYNTALSEVSRLADESHTELTEVTTLTQWISFM
jgi:maltodextrin utilization protein YvdJ